MAGKRRESQVGGVVWADGRELFACSGEGPGCTAREGLVFSGGCGRQLSAATLPVLGEDVRWRAWAWAWARRGLVGGGR